MKLDLKRLEKLGNKKLKELRKLKLGDLRLSDLRGRRKKSNKKWVVLGGLVLAAVGVAAYLQKDRKP
jgi:hypothetical protein